MTIRTTKYDVELTSTARPSRTVEHALIVSVAISTAFRCHFFDHKKVGGKISKN
jgi:hypothetical protein